MEGQTDITNLLTVCPTFPRMLCGHQLDKRAMEIFGGEAHDSALVYHSRKELVLRSHE